MIFRSKKAITAMKMVMNFDPTRSYLLRVIPIKLHRFWKKFEEVLKAKSIQTFFEKTKAIQHIRGHNVSFFSLKGTHSGHYGLFLRIYRLFCCLVLPGLTDLSFERSSTASNWSLSGREDKSRNLFF